MVGHGQFQDFGLERGAQDFENFSAMQYKWTRKKNFIFSFIHRDHQQILNPGGGGGVTPTSGRCYIDLYKVS